MTFMLLFLAQLADIKKLLTHSIRPFIIVVYFFYLRFVAVRTDRRMHIATMPRPLLITYVVWNSVRLMMGHERWPISISDLQNWIVNRPDALSRLLYVQGAAKGIRKGFFASFLCNRLEFQKRHFTIWSSYARTTILWAFNQLAVF